MKEIFLPILFLTSVFYLIYKLHRWQAHIPVKQERLYINNLCESIHALDDKAKELETLEEIITDLSICNADAVKGVRIIVPTIIGQDNSYTVLVDGDNFSSKQLLEIACSEREQKLQEIRKAITTLNSGGTITRFYQPESDEE